MPIYDFRCKECGRVSEFLISDSKERENQCCPGCGSINLEKLISAPGLLKYRSDTPGTTCCGRAERCAKPPCSTDEQCRRK